MAKDLEEEGYNLKFFNHAVPGTILSYAESLVDSVINDDHAQIVFLCSGLNDCSIHTPIRNLYQLMDSIITRFQQHNITVIVGMVDVSSWKKYLRYDQNRYIDLFNEVFKGTVNKYHLLNFNFINTPNLTDPEFCSGDNIHPNDKGFKLISQNAKMALMKTLKPTPIKI